MTDRLLCCHSEPFGKAQDKLREESFPRCDYKNVKLRHYQHEPCLDGKRSSTRSARYRQAHDPLLKAEPMDFSADAEAALERPAFLFRPQMVFRSILGFITS